MSDQNKTQIITIAGRLGSGKSSTAKQLAQKLNYEHFSSGDLFREIAAERGQSVSEANLHAEGKKLDDENIDELVDSRLRQIGHEETNKVIDSRTAWHWIPNSFKVYLHLPTIVAAERIILKAHERGSANEDIPDDPNEYAKHLEARFASENKRYQMLYEIDPSVASNYNLIIDTSLHSLDEVVDQIYDAYHGWLES